MALNVGGLRRRIAKGLGANLYNQLAVVVIQLGSVPILLHFWGGQLYGEWLILFAIPAYLTMTDLGFSLSAANDMTASVAAGDRAKALSVFQSLIGLVGLVVAAGFVVSTICVLALPVGRWMHFSLLSSTDVRWILWFLIGDVLLKVVDGVTSAGFRANGQYAFHFTAFTTTLFVQQVAIWGVAAAGGGPVLAATCFAAIRGGAEVLLGGVLLWQHNWLRLGLKHARIRELRRLSRPAMANLAVPLSQAISIQGMILVIGNFLGPLAVVAFSTQRTLSRFPLRLSWGVSRTLEPELAMAWGLKDRRLQRHLYARGMSASFWGALCACLTLYFIGAPILSFWTSGKVEFDSALFGWLLLTVMLGVIWNGNLTLLRSANLHLRSAIWYVFTSLAAVGTGAALLGATGKIAYAGAALVVMDGLMSAYLTRESGRLLNVSVWRLSLMPLNPVSMLGAVFGDASEEARGG